MWCAKIINLSDINDKYHVFFIVYIRQFPDKANKMIISLLWYRIIAQ